MKEFSATTTIKATPDKIWSILTNAAGYPEWDPSVDRIEGRIAPGEKITAYTKLSPGRAFPVTVSVFEPNRKMVWSSGMPLGLFKGERSFTLTPQSNGAVEFSVREVFTGPMLALIGRTLPDMAEPFKEFAAGLKRVSEAGS